MGARSTAAYREITALLSAEFIGTLLFQLLGGGAGGNILGPFINGLTLICLGKGWITVEEEEEEEEGEEEDTPGPKIRLVGGCMRDCRRRRRRFFWRNSNAIVLSLASLQCSRSRTSRVHTSTRSSPWRWSSQATWDCSRPQRTLCARYRVGLGGRRLPEPQMQTENPLFSSLLFSSPAPLPNLAADLRRHDRGITACGPVQRPQGSPERPESVLRGLWLVGRPGLRMGSPAHLPAPPGHLRRGCQPARAEEQRSPHHPVHRHRSSGHRAGRDEHSLGCRRPHGRLLQSRPLPRPDHSPRLQRPALGGVHRRADAGRDSSSHMQRDALAKARPSRIWGHGDGGAGDGGAPACIMSEPRVT